MYLFTRLEKSSFVLALATQIPQPQCTFGQIIVGGMPSLFIFSSSQAKYSSPLDKLQIGPLFLRNFV